jgi:hypothetical protein
MNDSLDANHQKMLAFCKQLSGTDFLKGHVNVIALCEKAAYQPTPPEIKQYAQNTLPMLQQHLSHAVHTISPSTLAKVAG